MASTICILNAETARRRLKSTPSGNRRRVHGELVPLRKTHHSRDHGKRITIRADDDELRVHIMLPPANLTRRRKNSKVATRSQASFSFLLQLPPPPRRPTLSPGEQTSTPEKDTKTHTDSASRPRPFPTLTHAYRPGFRRDRSGLSVDGRPWRPGPLGLACLP